MTIGDLLKQYRTAAGKTRKAWIGNIISPSFYSKVEKNTTRISAEDLTEILRYNNVKIADFFAELDYQNMTDDELYQVLIQEIINAYYQGDKQKMQDIRLSLVDSDLPKKEKLILDIDAFSTITSDSSKKLSPKLKNQLKEEFFNAEELNNDSLEIFCNFMYFYDFESNLIITKKIIKQFKASTDFKTQGIVLAILSNMISMCIENKNYDATKEFLEAAYEIPVSPEVCFYKMMISVLKNLVSYHFTGKQELLNKCESTLQQFAEIGMEQFANKGLEFIAENKD